jgi:signal peptidase I
MSENAVAPGQRAGAAREKAGEPKAAVRETSALREWTRSIAFAVIAWLFLRTFLVEAFRIPSSSMENTLLVGDFLFVNKAVYGPEIPFTGIRLPAYREPARNDILVFDSVEEDLDVVKRAVGVPGDTLEMRGGLLFRNGTRVDEPYAIRSNANKSESPAMREKMRAWQVRHLAGADPATYAPDLHDWGPIVVPPRSYFMMGDNRDESYDGRYWGFLPRENVRGTPMIVYYSYNAEGWRTAPWLTDIRWGRLFDRPR